MSSCGSCSTGGCGSSDGSSKQDMKLQTNPNNKIKKVIGVMSGKGGVGKSTIAVLIAKELNNRGLKVGVLDADITGPSVPSLLQVKDVRLIGNDQGILPAESAEGIKLMSLNLMAEDEEEPVIWRGAMISNVVSQFWTDVIWGELDYLIIDMPPGTGDVPLTVMQSIPISGMVMVSTPQDMVSMIVAKSVNMVRTMEVPIIGVVENMSYLSCPDCNKKVKIFENSDLQQYLDRLKLDLLGELPMNKEYAGLAKGLYQLESDKIIKQIVDKVTTYHV